jgi:hypothetical protein
VLKSSAPEPLCLSVYEIASAALGQLSLAINDIDENNAALHNVAAVVSLCQTGHRS